MHHMATCYTHTCFTNWTWVHLSVWA